MSYTVINPADESVVTEVEHLDDCLLYTSTRCGSTGTVTNSAMYRVPKTVP